ncbi:hypothetical protein [Cytobacillus solani]|uniref:Uncharacterized protein n=1 Tax=Cytobacillus solani TaxID=1637975 RepID=A0A0Q3T5R1_9BACI|nr:hypothetical protein [Cytobacillus solani]KQL18813.1 hypothetical protein AN957_09675 [Cytobacillus solani]
MGVSYYACKCCGESRYEEYVGSCTTCGKTLGTCCVVNDDIGSDYAYEYGVIYDGSEAQKNEYGIEEDWEEKGWVTIGEVIDDTSIQPKYCPFCTGEEIAQEDILAYLLKQIGKTHTEVEREYRDYINKRKASE